MGCNKRLFLMGTCCTQLITTIWRQIFDSLGFMWCPIIVNFFQMIFVIFGFFGAWQYKSTYTLTYCLWTLFWIGWNSFIFCFYLNIGVLSRDWDILSLGAGSTSWWEANGPGCKALFLPNQTGIETEPWHPLRPDRITGCIVRYYNLEATQAAIHAVLALLGFGLGISLNNRIKHGEQGTPSTIKKTIQTPLYPVDLMPRRVTNGPDFSADLIDENDPRVNRPMTPRRVKRRSDSRGYHTGSLPRRHHGGRSSLRSSRRNRSSHPPRNDETSRPLSGHTNLMFRHSPENSYDEHERPPSARSSYSNFHGTRAHSYRHFLVSGPPGYTPQSETPI